MAWPWQTDRQTDRQTDKETGSPLLLPHFSNSWVDADALQKRMGGFVRINVYNVWCFRPPAIVSTAVCETCASTVKCQQSNLTTTPSHSVIIREPVHTSASFGRGHRRAPASSETRRFLRLYGKRTTTKPAAEVVCGRRLRLHCCISCCVKCKKRLRLLDGVSAWIVEKFEKILVFGLSLCLEYSL